MTRTKRSIFHHPELWILLFIVGFILFSWPIFKHTAISIGELYGWLFIFWLACIFLLGLRSRYNKHSRDS